MPKLPKKKSNIAVPTVLKNSGFNLFGSLLPILIGSVTVPLIIKGLGTEGFGLLTLCWSLVGYFSIFDFGLTRALTVYVSEKISKNEPLEAVGFFWTATTLIVCVSLLASVVCVFFGYKFEEIVLSDATKFSGQLNLAFKYIAVGIPIVALHTAIKGTLEGYGKFFATNLLQSILGMSNFLLPIFYLKSAQPIPDIVLTLIVVRAAVLVVHFGLLFHLEPRYRKFSISRKWLKIAVNFGGWMTISNLVSPLMTYLDRFILSANVPVVQIAYYTTPFEIVSRLLIIPNSVVRALLPEMAKAKQTIDRKGKQFNKGLLLVSVVQAIPMLLLALGSKLFFDLWLGPEFGQNAAGVLSILSIGIWINSISLVPFSYLQTNARADLIAKIHLIEFPLFMSLLFFVVERYGVIGAAVVWTLRATFECICMFVVATRLFKTEQKKFVAAYSESELTTPHRPHRKGVLGIVITYHPAADLLENLRTIALQVDALVIVDNSIHADDQKSVVKMAHEASAHLIQNFHNLGIAKALNQGFQHALDKNFEFCVTFDHDTLPGTDYVKTLVAIFRQSGAANHIGWLGGYFEDISTGATNNSKASTKYLDEVDVAITSGALIPTSTFELVGKFREDFFIDYVDHEFCLRLKLFGFKVYLSPQAKLNHEFGKMKKQHLGPLNFYSLNYSAERRYFISRNRLILAKEYLIFAPKMFWNDFGFYLKDLFKILLVEKNSLKKLKGCWKGTLDGFMGQTGPLIVQSIFGGRGEAVIATSDEHV